MATVKQGLTVGIWWWLGVTVMLGAFIVLVLVAGCSLPMEQKSTLEQRQRESVVGATTTDIVTATQVHPPDVTVTTKGKDGSTTTVSVPATTSEQKQVKTTASEMSDSEASGNASSEIKLPLSVAILIGSIGLIVLAIAIFLLIKLVSKSKAFTAGFQWVDAAAAGLVNNVANIASTSTNPEVISALKTVQADVERFRADANKD